MTSCLGKWRHGGRGDPLRALEATQRESCCSSEESFVITYTSRFFGCLKSNDKAQNDQPYSTTPAHSLFATTIPCDRAIHHHGRQARRATPYRGLTPRGPRGRPRDAPVEQPHWRRKAKQQRQAPHGHYRHQSRRCRDHRTSACITVCFQALGGWVLATLGCAGAGARSHQHVLAPSPGG